MVNKVNDRAFEAVLQNSENIDMFIDEFFSFLARRTDFFVVSPPEGGKMGFPPGVAAKLIISKFKKWQERCVLKGEAPLKDVVSDEVPQVSSTVEINTSGLGLPAQTAFHFPGGWSSPQSSTNEKAVETSATCEKPPGTQVNPQKTRGEKKSSLGDGYNGRKTDKYSWSQSINELDVLVAVEESVKLKKDLQVEIHSNKIRVVVPCAAEPVVVDWKLSHAIIKDESFWSLHPGEAVYFCLQKTRERWWDHLFESEEPIDRTKIDPVKPMEDLDDEEQAKIQQVVWDQEQKLKGLPTSEESKLEEVMKKAWNAEGSPFKGQPFDMSKVQLANNSISAPK